MWSLKEGSRWRTLQTHVEAYCISTMALRLAFVCFRCRCWCVPNSCMECPLHTEYGAPSMNHPRCWTQPTFSSAGMFFQVNFLVDHDSPSQKDGRRKGLSGWATCKHVYHDVYRRSYTLTFSEHPVMLELDIEAWFFIDACAVVADIAGNSCRVSIFSIWP